MRDEVRTAFFSDAQILGRGADEANDVVISDIRLLMFPHGAVLAIWVTWQAPLNLSHLHRHIWAAKHVAPRKDGPRGWNFPCLPKSAFPLSDSPVRFVSVANWIVRMPWESNDEIPERFASPAPPCAHHSYVRVPASVPSEALPPLLHLLRRAPRPGPHPPAPSTAAQVMQPRASVALGLAREGIVAIEWGKKDGSSFQSRFFGIYLTLALHCLSERVTLERLGYMEAVNSQLLPSSISSPVTSRSGAADETLRSKDKVRQQVVQLATRLVAYRSCMASANCGGRPAFGEFFRVVRAMYDIPALKHELGEEVQDMLTIVNRDWNDERQLFKQREKLWKLKRDEWAKKIRRVQEQTHAVTDVSSNALLGVTFPILLVAALFGMNNLSLPKQVPWYATLAAAGVVSFVAVFVFLSVYIWDRRTLQALKSEKYQLNRERRQRLRAVDLHNLHKEDEIVLGGASASYSANDYISKFSLAPPVTDSYTKLAVSAQMDMSAVPLPGQTASSVLDQDVGYLSPARDRFSFDVAREMPSAKATRRRLSKRK